MAKNIFIFILGMLATVVLSVAWSTNLFPTRSAAPAKAHEVVSVYVSKDNPKNWLNYAWKDALADALLISPNKVCFAKVDKDGTPTCI